MQLWKSQRRTGSLWGGGGEGCEQSSGEEIPRGEAAHKLTGWGRGKYTSKAL
jgi:hypothetical protein